MGVFRTSVKENVLGVECGNSELDYYLQCPRRSLEVFKSAVTLTPFVESPEKGINRYRFLKVIGVGGFSKVYLGKTRIIFSTKQTRRSFLCHQASGKAEGHRKQENSCADE